MKITKESFIERYLKEDVKFNTRIKKYLLKFGIKENKCEICNISNWNGKEIVCQIHHVNGNRFDNRLENLQILCPNCHSQTENYMNKNTFIYHNKEVICVNCGKPYISKYKNSRFCSNTCSKEYFAKTRRLEISNYSKEYLQELCEKCNTLSEIGHIIRKSKETVKKHLILHGLFEDFLRKTDIKKASILQYSVDGTLIQEWPCITDAEETLKIYHIGAVCNGKRKFAGGYIWKYKKEDTNTSKIKQKDNSSINTLNTVSILQYDIEGTFLREFNTIKEASELTGTRQSSIAYCLKNKHKQANNFIWKYKEGDIPLHINTDGIKYGSKKTYYYV